MENQGYEDIDKLISSQNEMLDNAMQQQNEIVDKQTALQTQNIERQKEQVDKDATNTNKALYSEYKKATNPYGANAEGLASQGLGRSGYAETTQANLYNTYQKNVTDTLNNARQLKADFDNEINNAIQTGNITKAQNALTLYQNKMQLLSQEYELRNNREQYLYQKSQDALSQENWQKQYDYQVGRDSISDAQWQKSYDYQASRDKVSDTQWQKSYDYQTSRDKVSDTQWQKAYDYQKERDKVSDSQWEKEYQLSKKASASSSKKSSGTNTTSPINVSGVKENNTIETQETTDVAKATQNLLNEVKSKTQTDWTPEKMKTRTAQKSQQIAYVQQQVNNGTYSPEVGQLVLNYMNENPITK